MSKVFEVGSYVFWNTPAKSKAGVRQVLQVWGGQPPQYLVTIPGMEGQFPVAQYDCREATPEEILASLPADDVKVKMTVAEYNAKKESK